MTNEDYVKFASQYFEDPQEVRKAERELAERLKRAQIAKIAREALQYAGMIVMAKTGIRYKSVGVNQNQNPLQMM